MLLSSAVLWRLVFIQLSACLTLSCLSSAVCARLEAMMLLGPVAVLCILAATAVSVPPQEKRVHHQPDLSSHVHDDAHGYQYDHEAFLGKEEAKTFDQLTPEESKARLA